MRQKWLAATGSAVAFLWLTAAIALTYSTQRPIPAGVLAGMGQILWTVVVAGGILAIGLAAGQRLMTAFPLQTDMPSPIALLFSTGIGLGALALITLVLSVAGQAKPVVFQMLFAISLLLALSQWRRLPKERPRLPLPYRGWWLAAGLPLLLLALAPPEGFDALLYHLTQPEWVLANGRLQPWAVYPFWHPGLVEGVFTWALALHSDRAAQLIGLAYAFGAAYLVVHWAREAYGSRTGRYALLVLLSMPLLFTVAPVAYTDFPLAFYSVGALYALWKTTRQGNLTGRGLLPAAILAGQAMSIKYTAVTLPLALAAFLLWPLPPRPWRERLRAVAAFSVVALVVAAPWYARNMIYMGNPFYPFVFGGRFWDAFRAAWLGEPHTGIGLSPMRWLLLPWEATLGNRDAAYFHGRIGPLFLALFPFTVLAWAQHRPTPTQRAARRLWAFFIIAGVALWSLGVANSKALWQARLLLPALYVFAIPTAHGVQRARRLDVPGVIHVRYVLTWAVTLVAAATLLEGWVNTAYRHPITYMLGMETRAAYYRRALPDYADLTQILLEHTLPGDKIFFLFEPRSYGVQRDVLPDAILDHWAWYLHRYGSATGVLRALQAEGYTHVLLYRWGMNFVVENEGEKMTPLRALALEDFLNALPQTAVQGNYTLYEIPPAH